MKDVEAKPNARPPKKNKFARRRGGPPEAARNAPSSPKASLPGLDSRELAVKLVSEVLDNGRAFDEARRRVFDTDVAATLSGADKGLARLIAATVLRLKPALDPIIDAHLQKPLPGRYRRIRTILLCASAQLLVLKTPPHAAINLAVEQARRAPRAQNLASLVNAVLRKVAINGPAALDKTDIPATVIPDWMMARWVKAYGQETARDIASASLIEPPLDITLKADPDEWATRLDATVLETGSLRSASGGRIEKLDGYSDGAWWVQDAAAALPARLLGDVTGADVADLCAAPGGKTSQLASAGAKVVAVDNDSARLERVRENLDRLGLTAQLVTADVTTWKPEQKFDFVLLDAPCTATGTIRRHPDIMHLKREEDLSALVLIQRDFLKAAFELLRPNGTLVYCTCSLEPDEGELQITEFLAATPAARLRPFEAGIAGVKPEWLNESGNLRTLPQHDPRTKSDIDQPANKPPDPELTAAEQTPPPDAAQTTATTGNRGMDGFFAARIVRVS